MTEDPAFDDDRVLATWFLADIDGYRELAGSKLIGFARDPALSEFGCSYATSLLAKLDEHQGLAAKLLLATLDDPDLAHYERMWAARDLAGIDQYREIATDRLTAFATDTGLRIYFRRRAATFLKEIGAWDQAARLFTQFAGDPAFENDRVDAAWQLSEIDGFRDAGAEILVGFVQDKSLASSFRRKAARRLTKIKEYEQAGAHLMSRRSRFYLAITHLAYRLIGPWADRLANRLDRDD